MDEKFQSFFAQYAGQSNVGDTPENMGECVGLVEKWLDSFSLPHIWGNAIDLLNNADRGSYDVILNTPTNIPSEGDVVVLGEPFGKVTTTNPDGTTKVSYDGHTGLATKNCTLTVLELFQQNDTQGGPCMLKQYSYNHALGWIHPRIFDSPEQTPQIAPVPSAPSTDAVSSLQTQLTSSLDATTQCQTQLKSANDSIAQLTLERNSLKKQLDDAASKQEIDAREIIALNDALSNLTKSNKDYAQETYNAQQKTNGLIAAITTIAHRLKINSSQQLPEDLTQEILDKLDLADKAIQSRDNLISQMQNNPAPLEISSFKKKGFWQTIKEFIFIQ